MRSIDRHWLTCLKNGVSRVTKIPFLILATICATNPPPAVGAFQDASVLRVSKSGHWLEYKGKTILLVGDSVTQGWMELGEHFDQTAYIDSLARRGINVLLLWAFIGVVDQERDARIGYKAPTLWPWVVKTTGADSAFWTYVGRLIPSLRSQQIFDLKRLNEEYFIRLRSLVELAYQKDILVVITVHDGWTKRRFAGHPFNVRNGGPLSDRSQYVELADYGAEMPTRFDEGWNRPQKHQYFLERFSDGLIKATADFPNVAYEIFNEGEWYNQNALRAFQLHFLNYFKARTDRLLIINDDHVGGPSFQAEPKADVISHHRPNWSQGTTVNTAYEHYRAQFARAPAKPYFFTEPVPQYAGDTAMIEGLMRLMWGTAIGGASFVVQNDTSFGFDPKVAIAARADSRNLVLDLEGHCARFFNREIQNLADLRPDPAVCSTRVCLANPGNEYVVYAQHGVSFTVDVGDSKSEYIGRFYNPYEGAFEPSFRVRPRGGIALFRPADKRDWVLHLRVAAAG